MNFDVSPKTIIVEAFKAWLVGRYTVLLDL